MHWKHTYKPHDVTTVEIAAFEIELAELLTRRRFIIGAGGLLGVAALGACGAEEEAAVPTATPADARAGVTRMVEHYAGTTEISGMPERIVVLDGGADLSALCLFGVQPIAAGEYSIDDDRGQYAPFMYESCQRNGIELDDVKLLLGRDEVNLERVTELSPDLIVAVEFYDEIYELLSEIAPTILLDRGASSFREFLSPLAQVFDQPDVVDEFLQELERRTQEVAAVLPEDLVVSIVFISPNLDFFGFYIPSGEMNIANLMRNKLNIQMPEQQQEIASESDDNFIEVSEERLDLLDADYIFVIAGGGSTGSGELVKAALPQNSVWNSLDAVQQGNVRFVEYQWGFGGMPTAHLAVLDDLEAWFGQ